MRMLFSIVLMLAALLFLIPREAEAQVQCSGQSGERIVGMGGPQQNIPLCVIDGRSTPQSAAPAPTIDQAYQMMRDAGVSPPSCEAYFTRPWGAIYESADGQVHQTHCKASQQDAVKWAQIQCERSNRGPCRPVFVGKKQVVAITRHANRNYIAANGSGKKAIRQAQDLCRKAGGSDCRIQFLYDSRIGPQSPTIRY